MIVSLTGLTVKVVFQTCQVEGATVFVLQLTKGTHQRLQSLFGTLLCSVFCGQAASSHPGQPVKAGVAKTDAEQGGVPDGCDI